MPDLNVPDLNKMDRTWLCSVLFMDIAAYSSQSVELQIRLKQRFNQYLSDAIRDVPESERVILDTGDGAAVCFLGAPEAAMFTALKLLRAFVEDQDLQTPGLRVRLGVNLGPVKLLKDINGALNAIGDGMNAGQRVMSFASENQILVSQSYYEVVSRLSDDYKVLFRLKGVETDKHIREHTVYYLLPPGSQSAKPAPPAPKWRRPAILTTAVILLAALAVSGFLFFKRPAPVATPVSALVAPHAPAISADLPHPSPPSNVPRTPRKSPPPVAAEPDKTESDSHESASSATADAEYKIGKSLIKDGNAADAIPHLDKAIQSDPRYINARIRRAEAYRMLNQYDRSMEDCNRIVQIDKDNARGYNCRGLANHLIKHYEASLTDFSEAIRRKPDFAFAYANRAIAYSALHQFEAAIQDFTKAIALDPEDNDFRLRRADAYSKLAQYPKAIEDYSEVIRRNPDSRRAYRGRAAAKEASGDLAAAKADRDRAN